ncbi:MAG: type IX secretion system protein PorQ [Ignavibacteria bacterium]|nr:type IX secretion system protein PorQ [Ignavibacteria bacterium]
MTFRTMTLRLAVLLILAVTGSAVSVAGSNTTYDFLRNDVGARAAAMAGSFVSMTEDPTVLFYNPAALSTLGTPQGSIGFFKHLLDINSGYVSYSQSVNDVGNFGAGVVFTNYGSFDETDDIGNTLGTFSANDFAFVLGYSNVLDENLYYGANVKFIYSKIAGYSSTGIAGDVGILFRVPDSRLTFGASIRNVGSQLTSYLSTREDLPLDVAIGASVVPRGLPLLLNLNFHKLNEEVDTFGDRFRAFSIGGEFTLSSVLRARFGYDNERRKELKIGTSAGLAGFSGGLGITISEYTVDYALSSLGKVGSLHRISIARPF